MSSFSTARPKRNVCRVLSFRKTVDLLSSVTWDLNILITARPILTHVTLHTHNCCSIELLYSAIAHSLILKAKRTKGLRQFAHTGLCTNTQTKQTHIFTWKQLLYGDGGQTDTHTHTYAETLSRMQENNNNCVWGWHQGCNTVCRKTV